MTGILNSSSSIYFPSTSSSSTSRRSPPMRILAYAGTATARRTIAPSKSPYDVLRIKETATAAEIKTAYRSLAKLFHPDAATGAGHGEFIEIHDAYTTLSDPTARAQYDMSTRPFMFTGASSKLRTRRWETDQCW